MPALDIGTMNIVKAELDEIDDSVSFQTERNIFAEVRKSLDDPETVLKDNHYAYIKHKDNYYVVGEDVFKVHEIESLFKKSSGASSYFSEVRRPMKDGLINTAEEKMSIAIIQEIIKRLIGKPSCKGEVLCFCAPGDPVNSSSNVLFHKSMLTGFIKSIGYIPECINEAVALIYSECPSMEADDEADGIAKFSGIGFSFGAGMCNCALVFKQLPLLTFSICNSGDWIDQEAAKIAGCDIATITKYKERHLDLSNINTSDLKQQALEIFYASMIENALMHFSNRFEALDEKLTQPIPIVVAGGTASVPGFIHKFKEVLDRQELPFNVKSVTLSKNPLYAVANGCLIKAISVEAKLSGQNKPIELPTKSKEKVDDDEIKKEKPTEKIKLKK